MTLDFVGVFADAWRMWRRDHAALLPIAGLFLFVPQWALLLLVTPPPQMDPADRSATAMQAWSEAAGAWLGANGIWYVLAFASTLFGALAVVAFYAGGPAATVGAALRRALALLLRYALATILVTLPASVLMFILSGFPGGMILTIAGLLYLLARTMLIGPVIVAERPIGARAAIVRSWRLTRGNSMVLFGVISVAMFTGPVLSSVVQTIGGGFAQASPVQGAFDAVAALLAATSSLAVALADAAVYRRLAGSSRGI